MLIQNDRLPVEDGRRDAELFCSLDDTWKAMGPIVAAAGDHPDPGRLDVNRNTVPVPFNLVGPFRTAWRPRLELRQTWLDAIWHWIEWKVRRLVVRQQRLGRRGYYHYRATSWISKEGLNIGMAAVNLRCVTGGATPLIDFPNPAMAGFFLSAGLPHLIHVIRQDMHAGYMGGFYERSPRCAGVEIQLHRLDRCHQCAVKRRRRLRGPLFTKKVSGQIVNRVRLAVRVPAINLHVERLYRNPNMKIFHTNVLFTRPESGNGK